MMANIPMAFAIQEQVRLYEQDKMTKALKKLQRENAVLTERLAEIKTQKITSWSVSGNQQSDENFIRFRSE